GVLLFEVLTGQLPFAGRNTMDVLLAHATEEPPSFSAVGVVGLVPAPIERVVQACLAKNPDHRPRHARELSEMYREALASVQAPREQAWAPGWGSMNGARSPRPKPAPKPAAPAPYAPPAPPRVMNLELGPAVSHLSPVPPAPTIATGAPAPV